MQLNYVTQSSSGSSPWHPVDDWRNPVSLGVSVIVNGLSGTWQLDLTMDDTQGFNPNPTLNPGQPFGPNSLGGKNVSVLGSSAFGGPGATSSAWYGILNGPFSAWRLTNNSSAGTVTASVLQAGPRTVELPGRTRWALLKGLTY
jgi:hypothetical protein